MTGTPSPPDHRPFLAATGRTRWLPLYEPFTALLGARPAQWRLVAQAGIAPGSTVLEIGAGTGAVVRLAARAVPSARVIGLDPDAAALAAARDAATREGLEMDLDQGFADALPYPDASVDRVLSSFMFHHVPADEKPTALAEIHRVLRPGGSVHLMDFDGGITGPLGWVLRLRRGHAHGHEHGHGHGHGHDAGPVLDHRAAHDVVGLLREAGFVDAEVVGQERTRVGPATYYRASV